MRPTQQERSDDPILATPEVSRGPKRTASRPWLTSGRRFPRRPAWRPETAIVDSDPPPLAMRRDATFRRTIALADALAVAAAVLVGVVLLGDDALRWTAILVPLAVVFASKVAGLYDRDEILLRKSTLEEAPAIFEIATLFALTAWLLQDVWVSGDIGQRQVVGLWVTAGVATLACRTLARSLARRATEEERCIVLGDATVAARVQGKLEADGQVHARVVGAVRLAGEEGLPRHESGAAISDLPDLLRELDAHRVVVAPHAAPPETMTSLIRCMKSIGVRVSILPTTAELVGSSVEIDEIHGVPLLGVRRFGLTRSSQFIKRGLDIAASATGLLLTAPLIAAIALAIKLDSRGPVFFRQTRVGRGDRHFRIVKFRSMQDDAEGRKDELRALNEAVGLFKIADDPRITRVGRILRKTSLDELPQLWNVLVGEMSLVGPRPLVEDEDSRIEGWYRRRLQLTPGITGHWQVLGSSRIPLDEMVEIDYLYLANWTLWTDVKILFRTLPRVVARTGQ